MSKVVLITGAGTGFGLLSARALVAKGYHVWAGMRDVESRHAQVAAELRALGQKGPGTLNVVEMDVCSTPSVEQAVQTLLSAEARLDVLVNNAGLLYAGVSESYSVEQFEELLQVGVVSLFRTVKAVLPTMRKQRSGLLVHISSIAGRMTLPFLTLYCATKHAVDSFGEGLHYELSELGVESVLVQPGLMATSLHQTAPQPARQEVASSYGKTSDRQVELYLALEKMIGDRSKEVEPELVRDAVVGLIEAPSGTRPLRTVVGIDWGVREINRAVEPYRTAGLNALGLGHLDQLKVPSESND